MKFFKQSVFFVLIVLVFAYINTQNIIQIETFTPKIRQMYRPIVRNTRVFGEGFYNKTTNNISTLFRRYGIYNNWKLKNYNILFTPLDI